MSRVITFSQKFPATHPRKGEQTYFKEKIWAGLADILEGFKIPNHCTDWDWYEYYNGIPKLHTIRAGKRWKVGDKFSPRVWSGRPYASKQIVIAEDIEIKKIYNIRVDKNGCMWVDDYLWQFPYDDIATNDGLNNQDFIDWLIKPAKDNWKEFNGQIICWSKKINYKLSLN